MSKHPPKSSGQDDGAALGYYPSRTSGEMGPVGVSAGWGEGGGGGVVKEWWEGGPVPVLVGKQQCKLVSRSQDMILPPGLQWRVLAGFVL